MRIRLRRGLALFRVCGCEAHFQVFVDAEADGGVGELAEEGGGQAGVEAGQAAGRGKKWHEGAEHGFRVCRGAGLEAGTFTVRCVRRGVGEKRG